MQAIGTSLRCGFTWYVLVWRPAVLNAEVVSRTEAECTPSAIIEMDGQTTSNEEKCQRVERLELLFFSMCA